MIKLDNEITVYIDFDGTITTKDVGDEIFIKYGVFEPYHSLLREGKLDIKEYWKIQFNNLKEGTTIETLKQYALGFEIDANFKQYLEFSKQVGLRNNVVSDGFDFYINAILSRENIKDMPVFCNYLLEESNKYVPKYPGASESCDCTCASCKRNRIINNSSSDEIIVYIGDGYSDFCAANHADIIISKKSLTKYCFENKLPHYGFKNFFDVIRIFKEIITDNKLRKRKQAELLRKKAFENE